MPFFLMAYCVVARDLAPNLAMMPGALSRLHVLFCMGRGTAGNIGSADVADGYLYRAIDGNALSPSLFVDDPDAFRFLYPGLL